MNKWIKISDRLPDYEDVFIYSERRGREIGKLGIDGETWWTKTGASFQYEQFKEVTHWMPLPKYPK